MANGKGCIIMPDGSRLGIQSVALRLGVGSEAVRSAITHAGYKYSEIRDWLWPDGNRTSRVAKLDPDDVYFLASFSRGQKHHREILMQLLGLDDADMEEFDRRFPDV